MVNLNLNKKSLSWFLVFFLLLEVLPHRVRANEKASFVEESLSYARQQVPDVVLGLYPLAMVLAAVVLSVAGDKESTAENVSHAATFLIQYVLFPAIILFSFKEMPDYFLPNFSKQYLLPYKKTMHKMSAYSFTMLALLHGALQFYFKLPDVVTKKTVTGGIMIAGGLTPLMTSFPLQKLSALNYDYGLYLHYAAFLVCSLAYLIHSKHLLVEGLLFPSIAFADRFSGRLLKKRRVEILQISPLGEQAVEVVVSMPEWWKDAPKVGDYAELQLPRTKTERPFTYAGSDMRERTLRFMVAKQGGATRDLHQLVQDTVNGLEFVQEKTFLKHYSMGHGLNKALDKKLITFSSGTGMAPFHHLLSGEVKEVANKGLVMIHSDREIAIAKKTIELLLEKVDESFSAFFHFFYTGKDKDKLQEILSFLNTKKGLLKNSCGQLEAMVHEGRFEAEKMELLLKKGEKAVMSFCGNSALGKQAKKLCRMYGDISSVPLNISFH